MKHSLDSNTNTKIMEEMQKTIPLDINYAIFCENNSLTNIHLQNIQIDPSDTLSVFIPKIIDN